MRRLAILLTGLALVSAQPFGGASSQAPASYSVEALGQPSDPALIPRAINTAGAVAGIYSVGGEGTTRAFRLVPGQPLETLPDLGGGSGEASGINDSGQVTGTSRASSGYSQAFRFTTATGIVGLGDLGGGESYGFAVNASGQLAGYSMMADIAYHGFRHTEGGGFEDFGTLGGFDSYAYGINAAGELTGCSATTDGYLHAFRATGPNALVDLGVLPGGAESCGLAVNADGQIAGYATASGYTERHAVRWDAGAAAPVDLGVLLVGGESYAYGINDSAAVVGWAMAADGYHHAVLHTPGEGLVDLNTRIDPALGWLLAEATGINSDGVIVGFGYLNGVLRGFKLTPPVEPETPEPPADTTPPTIRRVIARPPLLWPAFQQMVQVRVLAEAADDGGGAVACRVTEVVSSEADSGLFRGDRPRDIVVTGDLTLRLRAEVGPRTRIRIYTITVACADAAGNSAEAETAVWVPRMPFFFWRWF